MRAENAPLCGRDHLAFRSYYYPVKVSASPYCDRLNICPFLIHVPVKVAYCDVYFSDASLVPVAKAGADYSSLGNYPHGRHSLDSNHPHVSVLES